MTYNASKPQPAFKKIRSSTVKIATVSLVALSLMACSNSFNDEYKLGLLPIDHDERHKVHIHEKRAKLSVPVNRGSYGLQRKQEARVHRFLAKHRGGDTGNSKLLIAIPSGSANEVAARETAIDMRETIIERGFKAANIKMRPYTASRHSQPPIRISYIHYVAEAPECGNFPTNLGFQPDNMQYENFGCATQRNFINSLANKAHFFGPADVEKTPRSEERRRYVWDNYIKGRISSAERSRDERAQASN